LRRSIAVPPQAHTPPLAGFTGFTGTHFNEKTLTKARAFSMSMEDGKAMFK
jgi:hypothetical protein